MSTGKSSLKPHKNSHNFLRMDGEDRLNGITNVNNWEEQCVDAVECDLNDLEEKMVADREVNSQRLWLSFQNAANAVAQLFKERGQLNEGSSLWTPFQDTANLVTLLYKGSLDIQKKNFDAGHQLGHKKRNRDVIAWVKKKKRAIRREELLSYLSGLSPPRYQRVDAIDDRANEVDIGVPLNGAFGLTNSLHTPFLSSGVNVPAVSFTGWNKRRNSRNDNFGSESENRENFRDTRKRSNQDVVMDSVGHKKCRFL